MEIQINYVLLKYSAINGRFVRLQYTNDRTMSLKLMQLVLKKQVAHAQFKQNFCDQFHKNLQTYREEYRNQIVSQYVTANVTINDEIIEHNCDRTAKEFNNIENSKEIGNYILMIYYSL